MCEFVCLNRGEDGHCKAEPAGSMAIDYAGQYYCKPNAEVDMEKGVDPGCSGSEIVKKSSETSS